MDPIIHPKDFVMLEDVLEGLFDKPLADLPKEKRKYAELPYFPGLWDALDKEQRLVTAELLDSQRNPDLQPQWEKLEKAYSKIDEYERSEATTALNITEKDKQLMRLHKEADRLENLLSGPINDTQSETKVIGEPKQKSIDQRVNAIVKTAKTFKFDLQSIPYGGKRKIKDKCLNDRRLFSDSTFEKAWQEAKRQGLIEIENAEMYTKGR